MATLNEDGQIIGWKAAEEKEEEEWETYFYFLEMWSPKRSAGLALRFRMWKVVMMKRILYIIMEGPFLVNYDHWTQRNNLQFTRRHQESIHRRSRHHERSSKSLVLALGHFNLEKESIEPSSKAQDPSPNIQRPPDEPDNSTRIHPITQYALISPTISRSCGIGIWTSHPSSTCCFNASM